MHIVLGAWCISIILNNFSYIFLIHFSNHFLIDNATCPTLVWKTSLDHLTCWIIDCRLNTLVTQTFTWLSPVIVDPIRPEQVKFSFVWENYTLPVRFSPIFIFCPNLTFANAISSIKTFFSFSAYKSDYQSQSCTVSKLI